MKRFLIFFAPAVMVICLAVTSGCRGQREDANQSKQQKPLLVKVEVARRAALTRTLNLTGNITATRVALIASPAEGPVQDCKVREGDSTRKGQALLTIGRSRAARAMLKAAQENLSREKDDARRVERLVQIGGLPAEQLEVAKVRVSRARAELKSALESKEDYMIRAPWAGLVTRVFVADGEFVAPRTPLVEIFDPESLVIRFSVPESDALAVGKGMRTTVTLDAYSGKSLQGKIIRVYPELDNRTRTRTAEAVLTENLALVPGMFARIELELETLKDALVVPLEAVIITPEGGSIAYIVEQGRAVRRNITTGIEEGRRIQILEGIRSGEKVVVAGNEKLKNGAPVRLPEGEKIPGQKTGDKQRPDLDGSGDEIGAGRQ